LSSVLAVESVPTANPTDVSAPPPRLPEWP
jgi:hypothetical protein